MENIDDLFKQMEADDLADEIEESGFATPINYARSRSITPQSVYYHIRAGHLTKSHCACGRWVITVSEADEIFRRNNANLSSWPQDVGHSGDDGED